jgi:hypothetical protein
VRLRDIATTLGITERTAYGIVTDLTAAGYVVKDKNGRRNRYQIQVHLPMREVVSREPTIGEVLELLVDSNTSSFPTGSGRLRSDDRGLGNPAARPPAGDDDGGAAASNGPAQA